MRSSIRAQLIISFLLVVTLSLAGLSMMEIIAGGKSAQEEINRQLITVISFKGQLLNGLVNTLKAELGATLTNENFRAEIHDMLSDEGKANPQRKLITRSQMEAITSNSQYFEELSLVDLDGNTVVSTIAESEGQRFGYQQLIERSRNFPSVSTPAAGEETIVPTLHTGYPIRAENGVLIGILVGQTKSRPLLEIFNLATGLRERSDVYLLDVQGQIVTGTTTARRGQTIQAVSAALTGATPAMMQPMAINYTNVEGVPMTSAYLRLPDIQGVLLIEQVSRDIARTRAASLAVNLSVTLSSGLIAFFIALLSTRRIADPLSDLVDISTRISDSAANAGQALGVSSGSQGSQFVTHRPGPLHAEARELVEKARYWSNETGVLAKAFSRMTLQLSGLIANLEQRVSERTSELEQHTRFLEASADISRAATQILDPDVLIPQAVELIRDRYDLYYVGLFLNDAERVWAVLRAGTGAAGQAMLARGHRLRLEPTSMIGWCITNDQPRIAQTASEDEVRVVNPELPETRSEAAIPLHARGQVIGALTVQSSRFSAFSAAGISALQTMADQLAIAIDNAGLFARSQQALEAERRAYARQTQVEWSDWLQERSRLSVRGNSEGIAFIDAPAEPQKSAGDSRLAEKNQLAVPIRVRGQTIGVIHASRAGASSAGRPAQTRNWSGDEVFFLETIAEQLGVALDGARLYAETRKRAEQERLVDDLTGKMRATLDIQTVLETAAREMRDALRLAEVEVRLGDPDTEARRVTAQREGDGQR